MKPIQCYEGSGPIRKAPDPNTRLAGKRGRVVIHGVTVMFEFKRTAPFAGNLEYLDFKYHPRPGHKWNRYSTTSGCLMCKWRPDKKWPDLTPPRKFMNAKRTEFIDGLTRADVIEMLTPHVKVVVSA